MQLRPFPGGAVGKLNHPTKLLNLIPLTRGLIYENITILLAQKQSLWATYTAPNVQPVEQAPG